MNRAEYHKAVKDYSGRLYRFVYKCLRNSDDAQDIVQDTYAKLWQNRKKVEIEKAKSWLFTVAYNGLLNFIKTRNRIELVDEYTSLEPYMEEELRMELKEVVDNCLELLPPIQRSVLLLRDLEGYEYKEIGDILNLNESQVKVYLFRARQKIKNHLKDLTVLS
ncbi:MAG: RNA polymerase sigma factor [Flavobacteriales bacterium]|nr:RNA polymerase sigma factor [Flavobacteriales bacterium]